MSNTPNMINLTFEAASVLRIYEILLLTIRIIVEYKFNSSWNICEDVQTEDDDDKEGPNVSATVHVDLVEDEDDDEANDMNDTNTKNQDHKPLFITVHQVS